ncbi:MAG: hypothetical protein M3Q48_15785 [Actinomycetota bacterium]|nr:hypothetical protein [Actinomycetota bacterium]
MAAPSEEVFRTPAPVSDAATTRETANNDSGASPWLLVPLALLALGFFAAGTGIFLTERRKSQVKA